MLYCKLEVAAATCINSSLLSWSLTCGFWLSCFIFIMVVTFKVSKVMVHIIKYSCNTLKNIWIYKKELIISVVVCLEMPFTGGSCCRNQSVNLLCKSLDWFLHVVGVYWEVFPNGLLFISTYWSNCQKNTVTYASIVSCSIKTSVL